MHRARPVSAPFAAIATISLGRTARSRASFAAVAALSILALSLGACADPTATPEPPPVTALPDPPTVEPPPSPTAVATPTATLTPTATAAPTVMAPNPIIPTEVASPVGAQPTTATPVVAPTTAPPPTANSGLPVIEFYPDNGQAQLPKDQLCTAVNWRTENVTDVRLQVGGGTATSVAASGRQGDICFGEDKLKIRLIYKLADGREESREIDLTRDD